MNNRNGKQAKPAMLARRSAETDKIAKLWAQVDADEAMGRYDLAIACRRFHDNSSFGDNRLNVLADRLKVQVTTLYPFIRVARAWPTKAEFTTYACELNANGQPLSWSHYKALARVRDVRVRAGLRNKALQNSWTYSQLTAARRRMKANVRPTPKTAVYRRRKRVLTSLQKLVRKNASETARSHLLTAISALIEGAPVSTVKAVELLIGVRARVAVA